MIRALAWAMICGSAADTTMVVGNDSRLTSVTNATSANTVSTIVSRDGSGNFSAGTISAALTGIASGNLTSASTLDGSKLTAGSVANAALVNGAVANLSGTNTGDLTLGTFGIAPTAKGASIASQVLTLQPFDATHPGEVPTGGTSSTFLRGDATWVTPTDNGITALTGDCTASGSGSQAITCTKTNTVSFATSATTDTTNATNISSGTLANARTSGVSAATASTLVLRDSNADAQFNAVKQNATSTATASATLTMTSASAPIQIFTGNTGGQNLVLPDATTETVGYTVTVIVNTTSSTSVQVKVSGGANILAVSSLTTAQFVLTGTGSAAGTWSIIQDSTTGSGAGVSGQVLMSVGTTQSPSFQALPTAAVGTSGLVVGSNTAQTLGGTYTLSNAVVYAAATITSAANGVQAGCTALTKEINIVNSSTATTNSVCLPVPTLGKHVEISNATANVIHVFPSSSTAIGAGANNAEWATTLVAQATTVTASVQCWGQSATVWACSGLK